jgi:exodeoxyribonuclease VII large subunit
MAALLHRLAQRLDDLAFRQEAAMRAQMRRCQAHVAALGEAVIRRDPRRKITRSREDLADYRNRLRRSMEQIAHAARAGHGALEARLHSLSPLAVLDRGYAVVLSSNGHLVRSTTQLAPGDKVTTRLADGGFSSRVERVDLNRSKRKRPRKTQP